METPISAQITCSASYATVFDFTASKRRYTHIAVHVGAGAAVKFSFDGGTSVAFRVPAGGSVALDDFPLHGILKVADDGTGVVVDVNVW